MDENISVIIPYFNDSLRIRKTIDSVFSQTLQPFELLIIDDASNDSKKLLSIINHHEYSKKIKVYRNSHNKNGAYSRNKGMKLAKSKYIALLDADDYWLNEHLEKSILELVRCRCDFLYSNVIIDTNGHKKIRKVNKVGDGTHMVSDILFYSPPQTNSFFFDRKIFKTIKFDENLRRHQDYQFFLDVINSSYRCCYADISTSVYTSSHRSLKSRTDFDSMFSFWSDRIDLFTPKLLENYMIKLFRKLLILEPENIHMYMYKYKCLSNLRARKDIFIFEKLGFERFNLLLYYYFRAFFTTLK